MARTLFAIILGYAVMAGWVMITLTLAYKIVGPEFAFKQGTTDVTMGWILITLPLSFMGAMLGGLTAGRLGKDPTRKPVKLLAAVILLLGMLLAVAQIFMPPDAQMTGTQGGVIPEEEKSVEEMSSIEASSAAKQPLWYSFLIPLVGAFGVILGGYVRRASPPPASGAEVSPS